MLGRTHTKEINLVLLVAGSQCHQKLQTKKKHHSTRIESLTDPIAVNVPRTSIPALDSNLTSTLIYNLSLIPSNSYLILSLFYILSLSTTNYPTLYTIPILPNSPSNSSYSPFNLLLTVCFNLLVSSLYVLYLSS